MSAEDLLSLEREKGTVEREILGALIGHASEAAGYVGCLRGEWFSGENRLVFSTICDLTASAITPDLVTIHDRTRDKIPTDKLAKLTNSEILPAEIESTKAAHLRELHQRIRSLLAIKTAETSIAAAQLPGEEISKVAEALHNICDDGNGNEDDREAVLLSMSKEVEYNLTHPDRRGISTGYDGLDRISGGLRKGELVMVGARTSVGKTSLLGNILANVGGQGIPAAMWTLEMSSADVYFRIAAKRSRVNLFNLRYPQSENEATISLEAIAGMSDLPITICQRSGLGITQLKTEIRSKVRTTGARVVLVDYLSLLQSEDRKAPRYVQVAEISSGLKSVAMENGICVVAAVQLNRQAEGRRPTLADLRESGDLEQDADQVWLLDRKRDESGFLDSDGVVIVAKNRSGACGSVFVAFNEGTTTFEERT